MITKGAAHPLALAAVVAICAACFVLAACTRSDGVGGGTGEPAATRRTIRAPGREREAPSVGIQRAAGHRLDPSTEAELASAARRFATSLAGWLYGERREIDVEPTAPELRRELTSAPPYIPRDQIGSGDGQAVRVHVFAQTARSGVLVVTMRDSRTSYAIPASFELRAGDWQVVHLNTH